MKYKIFIIFHDEIDVSYYDESIINNVVFVNVNPQNKSIYKNLNVINLHEIKNFISLGKWYAESEVIYNIYKNQDILEGMDYIGFAHYDIDFTQITDDSLQNNFRGWDLINLQPYTFKEDFKQNILMDEKRPNRLSGSGINCYSSIFNDFNKNYSTHHSVDKYFENSFVCLCASFIVKKEIFNEMMLFITTIIESKKLDAYDTKHKYRIQGGLLERYYASWFLLKQIHSLNLKLKHEFIETNNQASLLKTLSGRISVFLKTVFTNR